MKRTLFLALLLMICLVNDCISQIRTQRLKQGDSVPDLRLSITHGDSIYSAHLADYKGKLVLLEFWGIHCGSCLASMPEMLELQNKFRDKIQIIFVTADKADDVQRLWKKFDKPGPPAWVIAAKQLSFVNGDTVLTSLFPHKVQPTHVWIDSNQIVKYVAYSNTTTIQTIQDFLAGRKISLDEQNFIDVDYNAPLTWMMQGNNDLLQYYSFITTHFENGGEGRIIRIEQDSITKKEIGFNCLNCSILELYKLAYKKQWILPGQTIPDNRIIVETRNREKYFQPPSGGFEWWRNNSFCYALRLPLSRSGHVYESMQNDLNRFFNVTAKVELKKVNCVILKQVARNNKFGTKHAVSKSEKVLKNGKEIIRLQYVSMETLFHYITNTVALHKKDSPFLNETTYKGKIDIELPWGENPYKISISELRQSLLDYGLDLVEGYRTVAMLVIRDRE